ncbi:hypothetical protein B0A52_06085 [Exophiala mesophila]|uniref:25S rRNA (Uridine(2843)-N(3))-methyltransferase n=1 Tax=Exophiala mesophila TaxID=212818 RepID=A0A438N587_EXOME|nr:hypothetical protein B0A52_06085 [Exophiala mesophila]
MAPAKKSKAANKSNSQKPVDHSHRQSASSPLLVPLDLQQLTLDVFRRAFPIDDQTDLASVIQEVKRHLFQRDFTLAFAKPQYLDAYALRWSASRALGYLDILVNSQMHPVWFGESPLEPDNRQHPSGSACKVVCIGGGGGAEVAACAAAARKLCLSKMQVHVVDMADWARPIDNLHTSLTTRPPLSPYASQGAKDANRPFLEVDRLEVSFIQHDILAGQDQLPRLLTGLTLCTIMFTLNELFTTSISRTTAFLLALTESVAVGSYFLVVDSPGSYSEVRLGQAANSTATKQYPMKWLLDHTLLEVAGGEGTRKWEKTVSDDSRWFRLSPTLKYPIDLENMRYQIHLYRRIESQPA